MPRKKNIPEVQVPTESVPDNELPHLSSMEKNAISEEELQQGFLEKWKNLDVASFVERGFQYRVKTKANGKQYMALRKGRTDRGLGAYTPSKEKLLFHYYPELKEDFMRRHPSDDRRTRSKRAKPFLSVPIKRVAVVPTNYRPSLNIIRYFHIFKKNGFPGDFSDFINGNIEDHFVKCNGIVLPVLLEDQEEDRSIKNVQ